MASSPPSKKLKVAQEEASSSRAHIFDDLHVYVVEQGLGKVRCNILKRQIENHGGNVEKLCNSHTTHVLVNKGLRKERFTKILSTGELGTNVKVVFVDWLSSCLVKGEIIKEDDFLAYPDDSTDKETALEESNASLIKSSMLVDDIETKECSSLHKKISSKITHTDNKNIQCDSVDSSKEISAEAGSSRDEDEISTKVKEEPASSEAFVCARPSTSAGENFNSLITDKLEMLQKTYTATQDRWRVMGYKKAIASIKKYHKPLETYEEVLQLRFVGEGIAKKAWEIIETGHLQRLDHIDPKVELINMFAGVWGAGPKTAEQWIAKGFKSLEDLQEKADLTFQQKIGLKYYDDINEKMPREEVADIEKLIRKHAVDLLPDIELTVCGSYRRGRPFCGDIDILVSHPDGKSHEGFLLPLLNALKEVNLVTDDLITVENEKQKKYMGMCKLPKEGSKYRRVDFIVAPYHERPLALLHFTGSAHFNRSLRLLAKKKKMSLSEHALRKGVVRRGGEKVNKGKIVPISSEKDVFQYLGLDYLEPTERDW